MLSNLKKMNVQIFIGTVVLIASIFHIYTGSIGFLEPREQRSLHLLFLLPLVFLTKPGFLNNSKARVGNKPGGLDYFFALLIAVPALYSYYNAFRINMRLEDITEILPAELILGGIMIVLILEAIRRVVSPVMFGLVVIGFAYLIFCEYLPGFFHFRDISISEIIEAMYLYNGNGIFGSITGISATLIAIFLIFGSIVEGSGTGRLFINVGKKVAGRYTGGPAKIAVFTSALFGSMSGSSSSNVFTTGSFSIPMMKKRGYSASFAGGVETAASVGGQSAPPIMGAGAFVMSEMTGIPYTDIIIAALLGSVCYFVMIFMTVHFEAKKLNLKGMEDYELPTWKDILKDIHLLIPIFVLITLLVMRFSPTYSALIAILVTFLTSWLRKHTRIGIKKAIEILQTAGRNTILIATACVGANIMVLILTKTGITVSVGSLVTQIVGDSVFMAGLLIALMTLVLGMGIPTTPAYIIVAAVGAPTLINDFNIPMLAAHFFVFYFAILADATPPVSIAAYSASSISGADPIVTGFQASRLAIAGYIVGFSYLFVPELLMQGTVMSIFINISCIILGLTIFAIALTGFFVNKMRLSMRLILVPLGIFLALYADISPEIRVGISLGTLAFLYIVNTKFAMQNCAAQKQRINKSKYYE